MSKNSVELNLYRSWYKEMEVSLSEMDGPVDVRTDHSPQIELVRDTIRKLQAHYTPEFQDEVLEMDYYRNIWPRFYAKLFFYVLVQQFCYQQRIQPARAIKSMVEAEERRINHFFLRRREFWTGYLYGGDRFTEQFTRAYCMYQSLEPLSIILEAAGGTLAGYWVAWGLAYEQYRGWLRIMEENSTTSSGGVYEWKETKSAAAELIKSQVEAESVYINGKPATAVQLRADFEQRYHVDLRDMDNLLYAMDTLKSDDTPYLSKLKQRFAAWKKRLGK